MSARRQKLKRRSREKKGDEKTTQTLRLRVKVVRRLLIRHFQNENNSGDPNRFVDIGEIMQEIKQNEIIEHVLIEQANR